MFTRRQANAGLVSAAVLAGSGGLAAAAPKSMTLPPPRMSGGMPLMQALKLRRSTRAYADRRCRRRFCPTCCGRPSASIARRATAPRPIGGTSW